MSSADPYLFLEDIDSDAALDWVNAQNAGPGAALTQLASYQDRKERIRAILDSDDRIAYVSARGEHLYNFWKDADHPRGLWRRTTWDSYRSGDPQWDVLLDLDALSEAEAENWVWHGASVLREFNPDGPDTYRRVLIDLSRGGSDADVTREFDLETREFVTDGFFRPESKGGVSWIDADTVFVYTDFGAGSMTSSGYPRIAKRWRRGQSLAEAAVVYEGEVDDMYIAAMRDRTPGFERSFVRRTRNFYSSELYVLGDDGSLTRIPAPDSAQVGSYKNWLVIELRQDWDYGGQTYLAGSLLATDFAEFMGGQGQIHVLYSPTPTSSLAGLTWTSKFAVLTILEDVTTTLRVLAHHDGTWEQIPTDFGAVPDLATVSVAAVDPLESDKLWLEIASYLQPPTLAIADAGTGESEVLASAPAFFAADDLVASQHFVNSADGTRIPYFLIHKRDVKPTGDHPTLLYAYGGFEVALTPAYAPALGAAWLEAGGVYALANIRGGGEYGPAWHQSALKENRNRCYEDLAAVAGDLVARGITSAKHLGVQGGSNGGLMAGNMLTQYPELFGAVVIQVPLLDMKRYSHLLAGASWMAEYGDPDTDDWEFIKTFSPYHLYSSTAQYPPVLITTSTRDDRVHPGHARKFAAKMLADGRDVTYYENTEGGHAGAANNEQSAHMKALEYTFLAQRLGLETP